MSYSQLPVLINWLYWADVLTDLVDLSWIIINTTAEPITESILASQHLWESAGRSRSTRHVEWRSITHRCTHPYPVLSQHLSCLELTPLCICQGLGRGSGGNGQEKCIHLTITVGYDCPYLLAYTATQGLLGEEILQSYYATNYLSLEKVFGLDLVT